MHKSMNKKCSVIEERRKGSTQRVKERGGLVSKWHCAQPNEAHTYTCTRFKLVASYCLLTAKKLPNSVLVNWRVLKLLCIYSTLPFRRMTTEGVLLVDATNAFNMHAQQTNCLIQHSEKLSLFFYNLHQYMQGFFQAVD